jgi:hypothetical protein
MEKNNKFSPHEEYTRAKNQRREESPHTLVVGGNRNSCFPQKNTQWAYEAQGTSHRLWLKKKSGHWCLANPNKIETTILNFWPVLLLLAHCRVDRAAFCQSRAGLARPLAHAVERYGAPGSSASSSSLPDGCPRVGASPRRRHRIRDWTTVRPRAWREIHVAPPPW